MHQQPSSSSFHGDNGAQSRTNIHLLLSHLELDLHESYDMLAIDDLSRLVASSKPGAAVQDKVSATSADVCLTPHFEEFEELRKGSYVVDPTEPLLGSSDISTFSSKPSPRNISFRHPQSSHVKKLSLLGCAQSKKHAAIETLPHEQMEMVEKLLASMEDEHLDMDSTSCAGGRKLSFQGIHEEGYTVQQLLGCNDDDLLRPRIKPAQHMHVHDFIGLEDSTKTVTATSALTKSKIHIQAERRRREKLNQRFIALSAILPGLKKMDKASVLGDAIKYVKQLEGQLKQLEESKVTLEACKPVSVKHLYRKDVDKVDESIPADIEARAFGKNVFIRVHCSKIKNILVKCLEELDRMPLSIENANVLSFSDTAVDLTFTAQIEEGSDLTVNDIVEALHGFFNHLKY